MIMVLSVVDFVVMCYGVYWDWVCAPSATPKQEDSVQEVLLAALEVRLVDEALASGPAKVDAREKKKAVDPIGFEL